MTNDKPDLDKAVAQLQQIHNQSGGNARIDLKSGTAILPANLRPDFNISELLIGAFYKERHKLGKDKGMMPEFHALVGTGEEEDKLPLKRFGLSQNVRPLIDMVSKIPRAERLQTLATITKPFKSFWLEMPIHDTEKSQSRIAHLCTIEGNALVSRTYDWLYAFKPTGTLHGVGMPDSYKTIIHPDRVEIVNHPSESNEGSEGSKAHNAALIERRADELISTLIVLGSPRFNAKLFHEETEIEREARVREYRQNKLNLRMDRKPKLPLQPIEIPIGPRLEQAIRKGKVKEIKELLGITSVRAHDMYVPSKGIKVPRREHQRRFPADEPIDRTNVPRILTASPIATKPAGDGKPLVIAYRPPTKKLPPDTDPQP